jgi:hypothetical protein
LKVILEIVACCFEISGPHSAVSAYEGETKELGALREETFWVKENGQLKVHN